MKAQKLSHLEKCYLAELYSSVPESVDQLPYTKSFDNIYGEFCQSFGENRFSQAGLWMALSNLRKRKMLIRKFR